MVVDHQEVVSLMPWIRQALRQRLDQAKCPEDLFGLMDEFPKTLEEARQLRDRESVMSA